MVDDAPPEPPLRLSPAVVTLLRIGAGYRSDRQMARQIGIDPGQLSRAKRQKTSPSLHMIRSFEARFPGLRSTVLTRPEGDPLLTLNLAEEELYPDGEGEDGEEL